jgi:hypothetical protein
VVKLKEQFTEEVAANAEHRGPDDATTGIGDPAMSLPFLMPTNAMRLPGSSSGVEIFVEGLHRVKLSQSQRAEPMTLNGHAA